MRDFKGVQRGRCLSPSCECSEYAVDRPGSISCCYCGCATLAHEKQTSLLNIFCLQTGSSAMQSSNPFAQALQQQNQPVGNTVEEVPSQLKVTERDLEAFKAEKFVFGQIPECPPPPELC